MRRTLISVRPNQSLPSGKRPTIISLSAVPSSLLDAAVDPVLGRLTEVFSLQTTFETAGEGSSLA